MSTLSPNFKHILNEYDKKKEELRKGEGNVQAYHLELNIIENKYLDEVVNEMKVVTVFIWRNQVFCRKKEPRTGLRSSGIC